MSKRRWDEEEIEQTLTDFPAVKDRQSKDELYRKIEQAEQMPNRFSKIKQKNRRPRFTPLVAAGAAAVIMLLIIPSFLDNSSPLTGGDDSGDEPSTAGVPEENDQDNNRENENAENKNAENEYAENDADNDIPEENDNYEASNNDNAPSNDQGSSVQNSETAENQAEQNTENDVSESQNERESETSGEKHDYPVLSASVHETDSGEKTVTISVSDELRSTGEEAIAAALNESDPTSNEDLQSITRIERDAENQGELTIDFAEDHELGSLTSNEYDALEFTIEEILSAYGVEEVQFSTDGESGVAFGPAGIVETLTIPFEAEGYFVSEEENRLISARTAGETNGEDEWIPLEETVEAMETIESDEEAGIVSAIPDFVEIAEVDVAGQEASVYYAADEELSDEEMEHFFQSMRLTGVKYNLEKLKLIDEDQAEEPVIEYEYDERIIVE
ncbi:hypothetical protein [Salisediminibacterium halotolerans]|uniref:hypothetical protein n=1 Tax=Salisediminibacterium halotolerans TaxID=517425 RepID=UPI000EACCBE7|nr:hypothetical protein [Salisediminibacterium halotolerans]RLJ73283.1 hypothetical protein BCL39_2040 [Actinophytocola xinjiangensis]RPE86705.1 hypothetical protein EDD67_2163 [Salisediminibacterium halotolerans]TWG34080.1 hypothetical protein BCL52_2037 [Salisediminibacterium halotolerans]GEL07594.1 hypothetical protein SHA02_10100 [Salisediminibacterium halotolerans]